MKLHRFTFRGRSFSFDPESLSLLQLYDKFSSSGPPSEPAPEYPAVTLPAASRVEILVNATQRCNLSCPYCFVHQGRFSYEHGRPPDLTPDLARKLVRVLPEAVPDADEYCIHFYGGEPLMNPGAIAAAVEEAERNTDHGFTFAVTTNGTIDPGMTVPLLTKGNFSVVVSIDGPEHIHDGVRRDTDGNPTHAIVREFLERITAGHGLFVRGSSVIRHGWSLEKAERYLGSLPVTAIKAQAARLPEGHPLALTMEERDRYFRELEVIAGSVIDGIDRGILPRDDRFNSRVLQLVCRSRRDSFCGAGTSVFGMGCDGTIYPCVLHAGNRELELGHISDPEFGWVRKGKEWVDGRKRREECSRCWALPLCGGGCPAMLSVCGEDECEYTRKVCEMAMGIYGSVLHKPDLLLMAGIE
ncbi:MAG: radical SAM protein [Methanoregula sp.]|jgi:uncharacterized protein